MSAPAPAPSGNSALPPSSRLTHTSTFTSTTVTVTSTLTFPSLSASPPPPPGPAGDPPVSSPSPKEGPPQPPAPDPGPVGDVQDPEPTPFPSPSIPPSPSSIALPEEITTSSLETLTEASPSAISDMIVSTIVTASTDSLGVHTYTKVTTIASFRALPTHPSGKPGRDTRKMDGSPSSSQNIGMIIMAVMGGLVVTALALLAIWWFKYRRRRRSNYNYQFTGYGSESPKSSAWSQRFRWALAKSPHERTDSDPEYKADRFTIGSFGDSQERITTPTPFYGQRSTETLTGKPGPSSLHVQFAQPPGGDGDSENQGRPRAREGLTQRDRPPTYYTTSTGVATIATTLPQYSAYDPSPISERSELPDTPTTMSMPLSPLSIREKYRRPEPRSSPLTPIGEKF